MLRARKPASVNRPLTFADTKRMALAMPGVEEGISYGTPAFRVKGKFFCRLKEDGETLVMKVNPLERDFLMQSNPDAFFITDHYRGYPYMLVRLSSVHRDELRDLLLNAWQLSAPKRVLSARATKRTAR